MAKSFSQFLNKVGKAARDVGKKIDNDKQLKGSKPKRPKAPKNDKFLGVGANGGSMKEELRINSANKKVAKNKKLLKDFKGPRTYKGKDGKVRPTKEWAAHLKKNGSDVVSKGQLKRRDHITQMTNAWKPGPNDKGSEGYPSGHKHLAKKKKGGGSR